MTSGPGSDPSDEAVERSLGDTDPSTGLPADDGGGEDVASGGGGEQGGTDVTGAVGSQ